MKLLKFKKFKKQNDLRFLDESSGYTSVDYEHSKAFNTYLSSFRDKVKQTLSRCGLDDLNSQYKDKEIFAMKEFEHAYLNLQKTEHLFTNKVIKERLLSRKRTYEADLQLIENAMNNLFFKED